MAYMTKNSIKTSKRL